MLISDFDYILPEEKIAKFGPKERGESRLLVFDRQAGTITDSWYKYLDQYLKPGDLVILNNTKVIPARILGLKKGLRQVDTAKIEILLTEFHGDAHVSMLEQEWKVVYRGKLKAGDQIWFGEKEKAIVLAILSDGLARLRFSCNPVELAQEIGTMPIPPYLKRDSTTEDFDRYQTEFGEVQGSVAAPTASLNFTNNLKERLLEKRVQVEYITLHVGLGTFLPVRTDKIDQHTMHAEYYEIPEKTIQAIQATKKSGQKVLAVGTTVCRTLEAAAAQIIGYELGPIKELPLTELYSRKSFTADTAGGLSAGLVGEADIFIYPGYEFKLIDSLLTNFHAPKSTPLLMASAFTSFNFLMQGYRQALQGDYKFLSFGDSCLIL